MIGAWGWRHLPMPTTLWHRVPRPGHTARPSDGRVGGCWKSKNSYATDVEISDYYHDVLTPAGFCNSKGILFLALTQAME